MYAIETVARKPFHRFVVEHDSSLVSYSLDILGRVGLGQADPKTLMASLEKHDTSNVVLSKIVLVGKRVLSSSFFVLFLSLGLTFVDSRVCEETAFPDHT
jgi:hypothetical protein